jgi:hypothetical protein
MAEYLISVLLVTPVVILWLVLLMPSDLELAEAEGNQEKLRCRLLPRCH